MNTNVQILSHSKDETKWRILKIYIPQADILKIFIIHSMAATTTIHDLFVGSATALCWSK